MKEIIVTKSAYYAGVLKFFKVVQSRQPATTVWPIG